LPFSAADPVVAGAPGDLDFMAFAICGGESMVGDAGQIGGLQHAKGAQCLPGRGGDAVGFGLNRQRQRGQHGHLGGHRGRLPAAGEVAAEKAGGERRGGECGLAQDVAEQAQIGGRADDNEVFQRREQPAPRLFSVTAAGDGLGEQRIVVGRDDRARRHAAVDAQFGSGRCGVVFDRPGAGQIVLRRILGVDARLDRPAGAADLFLRKRQRLARGAAQLPFDQVEPGDVLGHRMLHLKPGVHLQEIQLAAVVVEQKFHGAERVVADGAAEGEGVLVQGGALRGAQKRRGRLLDHLLVIALDRALALEQVHQAAVAVAGELHLDVARRADQLFEQHPVVAEAGQGLGAGQRQGRGKFSRVGDAAHAAPAAAGTGLDQQRKADAFRGRDQRRVGLVGLVIAGHHRHPGRYRDGLGGDLRAHGADRFAVRADESDAGVLAGRDQGFALGEKTIAGVDGRGAGAARGGDDGAGIEIGAGALGGADGVGGVGQAHVQCVAVGRGIDGDGADAEALAGADDADRDFAAVGDQDGFEHEVCPYIR
jgi:hypothetical protein